MTEISPAPRAMKNAIERRRPATTMLSDYALSGGRRGHAYAASRSARGVLSRATRTDRATPRCFRNLIVIQEMSNSYQARPCRAELGWAWWLLCQPSPKVNNATHQLLRESSRVANRREPHMCVAEFTSQVACRPTTTR